MRRCTHLALHSDDGARQGPGRGLNAAAIEAQRAILDDEVSDLCKWMTSRRAMSPGNLSAAGASDTSQRSAYRGPSRGVQGSMRARLRRALHGVRGCMGNLALTPGRRSPHKLHVMRSISPDVHPSRAVARSRSTQ